MVFCKRTAIQLRRITSSFGEAVALYSRFFLKIRKPPSVIVFRLASI